MINKFRELALLAELDINVSKTKLLTLRAYGREKKVLPYSPVVRVGNNELQFVSYTEPACYMCLNFNPSGMVPCDLRGELNTILDKLRQLRAKPQQRLFILREVLLPRFSYQFSFYTFSAKSYNELDILIRKFAKEILHLPGDVLNAFFYASIADAGLLIPLEGTLITA